MVASDVLKSRDSVLIATLTTVVSRIDMIAPSTTTLAMASSLRSSPSVGHCGRRHGSTSSRVGSQDGQEHVVDELLDEGHIERPAHDHCTGEDDRAGRVG